MIVIFTMAFGISMHLIVLGIKRLSDAFSIVNFGYWTYFSSITLLDTLEDKNLSPPIDLISKSFSFVSLSAYMLLSYGLLRNLMITMFKYEYIIYLSYSITDMTLFQINDFLIIATHFQIFKRNQF